MSVKVVRLNRWIHPCFDEILTSDPAVSLQTLDLSGSDDVNLKMLQEAEIYHVSAARDEVPKIWQVTPALLRQCPRLRVVSSSGAGYDTIDVNACNEAGVLVVNQAGGNSNSVAEHAFGFMISLMHRIYALDHALRTQTGFPREAFMGHELAGKVLGLVGIGHVGSRVAELASAFKMTVLAFDPYLDAETIRARHATPVALPELLAQSDIVSLHCPRNAETLGSFGSQQFDAMKAGALFLTTARGGIHDEKSLYAALASGHLGGAGLDVWFVEPPQPDDPLLQLQNVIATYHTAGVTHEARRNMAAISAHQILDICHGRTPPRPINPQVMRDALSVFGGSPHSR